ncbi:AMP-binding protein [Streptomyces sp. INA 01156]
MSGRPGRFPAGLDGFVDFALDLFDRSTIEAFLGRLERVLRAVVADPDTPISTVDVLSTAERTAILTTWNDTTTPVLTGTLPDLFQAQAARTPTHTALAHADGETLTYSELNQRANRLARHLIGHGAGPERIVALLLPRSVELLVAELAVLKTGAAFLPIDPAHPAERIAYTLEDADPVLVLTDQRDPVAATAGDRPVLRIHDLPLDGHAATDLTDADRLSPLTVAHPAYVIYTSGSTGRPRASSSPTPASATSPPPRSTASPSPPQPPAAIRLPQLRRLRLRGLHHLAHRRHPDHRHRRPPAPRHRPRRHRPQPPHHPRHHPPAALAAMQPSDLPTLTTLVVAGEAVPPRSSTTGPPAAA